jgi:hypothetical protein
MASVGAEADLQGGESEASRSVREADSRCTAPAMQRAPQGAALARAQPADVIFKHCLGLTGAHLLAGRGGFSG